MLDLNGALLSLNCFQKGRFPDQKIGKHKVSLQGLAGSYGEQEMEPPSVIKGPHAKPINSPLTKTINPKTAVQETWPLPLTPDCKEARYYLLLWDCMEFVCVCLAR